MHDVNRLALQRNRRLGDTRGSCRLMGASSMWNVSPLTTTHIRQGPFARPALTGVLTTTNPSDSPRSQMTVINSRRLLADQYAPLVHPRRGVSQVPWLVCRRPPPPTTPGSPTAASAHSYAVDSRLRHLWQVGHSQQRNEAESGSLALRLAPSSHGASATGSPRQAPDRLHGERAITKISSFQLTRPTRLCLAHQRLQKRNTTRGNCFRRVVRRVAKGTRTLGLQSHNLAL